MHCKLDDFVPDQFVIIAPHLIFQKGASSSHPPSTTYWPCCSSYIIYAHSAALPTNARSSAMDPKPCIATNKQIHATKTNKWKQNTHKIANDKQENLHKSIQTSQHKTTAIKSPKSYT
jgi:hypothetical protein